MSVISNLLNHPLIQKIHPYLQPLLRLVLGWIFLQSGWEKLQQMDAFYTAAANYKLLPANLTHFYATAVPWFEMMAGGYLMLGLFTRFAALLTGGLLLSFLIAIGVVLVRGDAIECGCFVGGKADVVSPELFIRDLAMLFGALYLYFSQVTQFSLDAWLADASETNPKNRFASK